MIHLPVGHPVRFGHRREVGRVRVREEPVTLGQRGGAAAVARDVEDGNIVEPPVSTRWIVGDRVLGVDVDVVGSGGGREGGGDSVEALGGEAGVVADVAVVVVEGADGSPDRHLFVVEEPVTLGQRGGAAAVARDVEDGNIVEPPVSTRWIVGDRVLGVDVDVVGSGGGREGGGDSVEALGGEAGVVADVAVVVVEGADGSPDRHLFVVEVEDIVERRRHRFSVPPSETLDTFWRRVKQNAAERYKAAAKR
ncbi:hypothetical protein C4D60_Mb01t20500 [Musa balbisiana]|uniref:Uncharacterized protein n=1 Tax=Musa balbisiana TaxID=52838 RepID=A0A4S8JPY5_MUSBA|nr:hypothetical protein C4D60_Mb01t20500 [Musa balbisiana]